MSVPVTRPSEPAVPGTARHDAVAAWDWLQAQMAGRAMPPVLTVIGLGDLSLLAALDQHAPDTKVLALEPDPVRARQTLSRADVEARRRAGQLVYLAAPQFAGAEQAWRVFPTRFERPPLLVHPASAQASGLRAAMAVLAKIMFGAKANAEARRKFAPRYILNSLRNLPAILIGRDVRELAGFGTGVPAVVVGAGPSLDQSIHELKRVGTGAVIVATDTALRPLLAHGIRPQLVVALDPSEMNCRHLVDLPSSPDTWLVAESALDPRATLAFHGRTFWFRVAPHQPWPWLNSLGVDVGRIDVWGSVLTAAFQVAALAGCDPIVMVGADLSFPGGRPYARGTTYEFDWAWAAAHGTPVGETWRKLIAERKGLRQELDVTGAATSTDGLMLEFRDWIVAQSAKVGRRIVNATGRGMLFGGNVEQCQLSTAVKEHSRAPFPLHRRQRPAHGVQEVAEQLRAVAASVEARELGAAPLTEWQEFSGDGFDVGRLGAALAEASARLATSPTARHSDAEPASQSGGARLTRLPESVARLRSALSGNAPPPGETDGIAPRTSLLVDALGRMARLIRDVMPAPNFVSFPDPTLVGIVPAGGIVMWPEQERRAALQIEALLGDAWDRAVPRSPGFDFADGAVLGGDEQPGVPDRTAGGPRLYAAHGCLLLTLEWLGCASSAGSGDGLRVVTERLWALEALMRSTLKKPMPAEPEAELVVQAGGNDAGVELVLPLAIGEVALRRMMTGALRIEGENEWALGGEAIGELSVSVVMRGAGEGRRPSHFPRLSAKLPRRVSLGPGKRLKVAGQTAGGVLCVVDFGTDTVLVRGDGAVEPYQTWPKMITGALSLGAAGDVAWSNVSQPQRGVTPYLMYRPFQGAEVVVFSLDFRPARGLWWRDRLYLTCNPGADGRAALASWAPGDLPVIVLRDMHLQGLVVHGDSLWLEPFVLGPGETTARQHAERGWQWTPGRAPAARALGPLGASAGSTVTAAWTATAYPQADVVILERSDGTRLQLRCYNPARVEWAGDSLVVYAGDGETLLFERLVDALEV